MFTIHHRPSTIHRLLIGVLLLALALRLGMGVFLGFNAPPDQAACGADTVEFEQMAWNAAQGKGFSLGAPPAPTAFRAPGYPMLLSAAYRVAGRAYWLNRVVLSLVGTITCALVYAVGMRLGLGGGISLLAALLTAVLPLQFYWCGHFMSEPLAACLNVAAVLALVAGVRVCRGQNEQQGVDSGCPWLLLLAGVLCGLAALTRPIALLWPPAVGGLWLCSHRVSWRTAVWWTVLVGLGMGMAVAPWSIRNRLVLQRWALIATNGGSTFWGANNAIVAEPGPHWGRWVSTNFAGERKQREVMSLPNEVDRDRKEWALGREYLADNPGRIPILLTGKLLRLVQPMPDSPNRIYARTVAAAQLFLLPLTLAGLVLLLRKPGWRPRLIPLNAQLLVLVAATLIFYGTERFRAAYEPFMALYAAVAIGWGMQRIRTTNIRTTPAASNSRTGGDPAGNSERLA